MNVNDSNSKALDDKLRNISRSKEMEVERIKKIYDKKVEGAKAEGEDRYESAIKRNDDMIAGVGAEYEQKLQSYKESLEKTEKNIAQAEIAYKKDHAEKMKGLKEQFANNVEDEFFRANDNQRSIQAQMKSAVSSVQNKSRNEQKNLESNARAYINALGVDYSNKIKNEELEYRSRLETDKLTHEETLRNQQSELKNQLDKKMQQGKRLEMEKAQVQREELAYLENHHRDMLNQRTADFKVRYETLVKEHEAILNELQTNLDADMKKMIETTASQKKDVSAKLNDTFYRIETLNPSVLDAGKELIVSLKVPEYEKENVHLSAHGRNIKMTLNRRFTDTMEAGDGSINRSTRNELYSKEFATQDILNPKQIAQKYDKGVLTFRIAKA